jgi:hypothetical protein
MYKNIETTRSNISALVEPTTRPNKLQHNPLDLETSIRNTSGLEHSLIPTKLADPKCPLCQHIITVVNEIFEHDDMPCEHPREYCISHLLEAVHTSLVWRLSKQ